MKRLGTILIGLIILFSLMSCRKKEIKPEVVINDIIPSINQVHFDVDLKDFSYDIIQTKVQLYDILNDKVIIEEEIDLGSNQIEFKEINQVSSYIIQVIGTYKDDKDKLIENKILKKSDQLDIIYPINTIDELRRIQKDYHYILNKDFDLTFDSWSTIEVFEGSLDGNYHEIKGHHAPLFKTLTKKAKVLRLNITNVDVFSRGENFGILAAYNEGLIEEVYVEGRIDNLLFGKDVGGLIAINEGKIKKSFADIKIDTKDSTTGGLVGINKGSIENSYTVGEIVGKQAHIGGLAGENQGNITYSYSVMTLENLLSKNEAISTGGITGINQGTVTHCFSNVIIELEGREKYLSFGSIIGNHQSGVNENNYRFEAQTVLFNQYYVQNFSDKDRVLTISDLNNPSFYENQLGFDPTIWTISNTHYPILRNAIYLDKLIIRGLSSTPKIVGVSNRSIYSGRDVDLLENVIAYDNEDGQISVSVNITDTSTLGIGPHKVVYEVVDSDAHRVVMESTLVVLESGRMNNFSLRIMPLIKDLSVPMTDKSQFDDYIYTVFNSGSIGDRLFCDTDYISCETLTEDFDSYSNAMYASHSYYTVQYIELSAYPTYIDVNGMRKLYTNSMITEIEDEASKVLAEIITYGMTEREMIRAISKYIMHQVDYDWDCYDDENKCGYSHSAYSVFFTKQSVCDGYSQAFDILARKLGIITHRLPSVEEGNHVWNVVFIDGEWLHLDLTWTDDGDNYMFVTTSQMQQMDPTSAHRFDERTFDYIKKY